MAGMDQQVRRVVEGLGAGLLTCGVTAVSSMKLRFELSFDRVWRSWTRSTEFPSVSKHPGEFLWAGICRSARRLGPIIVWDQGRWSVPRQVHTGLHASASRPCPTSGRRSRTGSNWPMCSPRGSERAVSGAAPTAGPDEHLRSSFHRFGGMGSPPRPGSRLPVVSRRPEGR